MGLLGDCEMLIVKCAGSADDQPLIPKGHYGVVSSEENLAFHWDSEVEGCARGECKAEEAEILAGTVERVKLEDKQIGWINGDNRQMG